MDNNQDTLMTSHQENKYNFEIGFNKCDTFLLACKNGKLNLIQWLFNNESNDLCSHSCKESGFISACENGHINVAQWLYNIGVNIHAKNNAAFLKACISGNIEIMKWLYEEGINIHINNDYAFRLACKNGYLEIAKWLYDLGANIHAENDDAFRWACFGGHLNIAQWLYNQGALIHIDNDDAFKWACKKNKIEVVKWLYNLDVDLTQLIYPPSKVVLIEVFQLDKIQIKLFRGAIYGNLKKIKWAIENGADYKMLDHFVFKKSRRHNKIEILRYLSNIDSLYRVKK